MNLQHGVAVAGPPVLSRYIGPGIHSLVDIPHLDTGSSGSKGVPQDTGIVDNYIRKPETDGYVGGGGGGGGCSLLVLAVLDSQNIVGWGTRGNLVSSTCGVWR